ncbi:hypothetical protein H4Q26_010044 [Puccinia striiformis f. sp. tritici PST-130]|nr:hypothetical protein H4Q26_010044 [Puccinia striiformis f. sp. tritici PST-130]
MTHDRLLIVSQDTCEGDRCALLLRMAVPQPRNRRDHHSSEERTPAKKLEPEPIKLSKGVMKVETCAFSGYKIYPSKGKLYVQKDSKESPTQRCDRRGCQEEVEEIRQSPEGIVGADLATILARRNQKPEVRTAQREEAVRKAKEEKKKKAEAAKKAATKAPMGKSTAPKVSKQQAKDPSPLTAKMTTT